MDNTTLAHIGGELVLIGGVAFYFHRKTTLLQEEVNMQKTTIAELVSAINGLQEDMNKMAMVIQQYQRNPARPPISAPRVPPAPRAPPAPQKQRESFLQTPTHVPGSKRKTRVESDDTGDETLDDRQLDAELAEELEYLENDGECSDGQCKLID